MAPTLAEARTAVGAAVKLALMPPTRVVRLTEALVRPVALISPTSALAVTLPASPVSRTDPAPAVARLAAPVAWQPANASQVIPMSPAANAEPALRRARAIPRARSMRVTYPVPRDCPRQRSDSATTSAFLHVDTLDQRHVTCRMR